MDRSTLSGIPPIRKVIFLSAVDATSTLQLVEYADGRFGILNGTQLVDARLWRGAELEGCIDAYLKLCRSLSSESMS
ncbi:MAG TPA: hypothetical protein VN541_19700 [Tepidisphaeraceae bacterium]|nr:hypothetical protein [Tepidisphaeraceae bacterium]